VTLKTGSAAPGVVSPYYVLGDGVPEVATDAFLHGMGVDLEIKVLKTDSLDLKPFVDFSWMMPQTPTGATPPKAEGGNGLTVGLLGRFNFGESLVSALRVITEFRSFSANFVPSYFDTFYEVQKYIANTRYAQYKASASSLPPTKFVDVFVDRTGDRRLGYYLEFNYSLVSYLALTLALEGSNAERGNGFLAHLEVPALSWLQFFATYHQRALDGIGDLFKSEGERIIFSAARLRVFPFMFVNFRYFHTFALEEGMDTLSPEAERFYKARNGWLADVEFGWEF
jgi:hypothetical protein